MAPAADQVIAARAVQQHQGRAFAVNALSCGPSAVSGQYFPCVTPGQGANVSTDGAPSLCFHPAVQALLNLWFDRIDQPE